MSENRPDRRVGIEADRRLASRRAENKKGENKTQRSSAPSPFSSHRRSFRTVLSSRFIGIIPSIQKEAHAFR